MMSRKLLPLVVIDTNVLVAGLRSQHGASFRLLRALQAGQYEIAVSVSLALEYESVLQRQAQWIELNETDIGNVVDYLCSVAKHTKVHYLWRPSSKDPGDDMLIELALAAGAQAIVSFNARDLRSASSLNIEVLSPREFLCKLQ